MTMNTNTKPHFSSIHTDTNTRISQMKLKPSFFLHCITNRGLPFPANFVDGQIQGLQPAINAKCISDGVDALRVVVAFLLAILVPDTTETIV